MNFGFSDSTSTPLEYGVLAKRAVPIILLVLFWCWETWRRPMRQGTDLLTLIRSRRFRGDANGMGADRGC
jgi:hypothetical protein